jgi:hypothetical protein
MPAKIGPIYDGFNDVTHPLACADGHVPIHTDVLYRKLGPGPHPCHWCGKLVNWKKLSGEIQYPMLHADHLNDQRKDNRPENLVPSCVHCNIYRGNPKKWKDGEEWMLRDNGRKVRFHVRVCAGCGKDFNVPNFIKKSKTTKGKYCSHECYLNFKRIPDDGSVKFVLDHRGRKKRAAEAQCYLCKKMILKDVYFLKEPERTFCSKSCATSHNNSLRPREHFVELGKRLAKYNKNQLLISKRIAGAT